MAIIIVGLGPGDGSLLTRAAWELLSAAPEVYVRTMRHPTVASFPPGLAVHGFDHLYESAAGFEALYEAIAERVVDLGRDPQGVIYAVPGHPLVGEASVQCILRRARTDALDVRIVDGLSFVEPTLSLLGLDGLSGLQLADATDLAAVHYPDIDPDRPALIGQLYSRRLASEVKLTLMCAYPDDHQVTLVQAAGTPDAHTTNVPLHDLDRQAGIDHLTSLLVPPLPHAAGLPSFLQTVARLRAPGGCPWDREQTHESLRPSLLEETYEALAALDAGDVDKLCEELGDLLMQIAMHAQIAAEAGEFRFGDLIGRIDAKLKHRHPHVFGDVQVRDSREVLRNWQAIKAAERSVPGGEGSPSVLAGVPAIMPALARAQELGERAGRDGFDWPDVDGVLDKLAEEVEELQSAPDREARAREMGDLLFTLVNVARWLELDAESALREACQRFTQRYAHMERIAISRGTDLAAHTAAEKEALWSHAKAGGLAGPDGSQAGGNL